MGAISDRPQAVSNIVHLKREVDWPHFCNGSEVCHDPDLEHDKAVEKKL